MMIMEKKVDMESTIFRMGIHIKGISKMENIMAKELFTLLIIVNILDV